MSEFYRFATSRDGPVLGAQATHLGNALAWAASRSRNLQDQTVHVYRRTDEGAFEIEATFRDGTEVRRGLNPPPPSVEPLAVQSTD